MSQKDQLFLPIDCSQTKAEEKSIRESDKKLDNITRLDAYKREREQEGSSQKIREYLDCYKIFM